MSVAGVMTAVPNDELSHVYISGSWSATGASSVTVMRLLAVPSGDINDVRPGDYPLVRPAGVPSSTDGTFAHLSGGYAVWYDTEMPLDTPVWYLAFDNGIGDNILAGPVTVAGDGSLFLKAPLAPADNIRIGLAPASGASTPQGCAYPTGTFFLSNDTEARGTNSTQLQVNNAPLPGVSIRPRGGVKSSFTVATRTFADRDAVIAICAPGAPLLWQSPAQYGIPDQYRDISDLPVTRGLSDHTQPWRTIQLTYTEVNRPAGSPYGVLGTRWQDQCDVGTWGDAEDAGYTWDQMMAGAYGTQAIDLGWRTYADVTADFATYAAVAAGGRTYEQLLEGQ